MSQVTKVICIGCCLTTIIVASSMLLEEVQLKIVPQSRNVSEGEIVEFVCEFPREQNYTDYFQSAWPPAGPSANETCLELPNGNIRRMITITAGVEHNGMIISCYAQRGAVTISANMSNNARLEVQGRLSSVSYLDYTGLNSNCSLHITWTAPYTLQGVPINYYTINITRHSDGAVVWSDTTNTTEYLYSVSSSQLLGETLEVVVAAVNDVGTGMAASITIPPPPPILIQVIAGKVIRSGDTWQYTFHHQMSPVACESASDVIIETCLNTICENISASIDDGVIKMMANLTRQRIYLIIILVSNNGIVVHKSHLMKISTFDVRSISITHPVTRGQVCLTVEYVEGHDPNPSCFVMFRSIATGHDLSVAINGTSMCVHLSPQVYTIVATDTEDEINTTAPAVIISNMTVPSYPQMSSSTVLMVLPTESTTVVKFHLPFPIFISIISVSASVICIVILTGLTVTVLVCVLQRKKKIQQSTPVEQVNTASSAAQDCSIDNTMLLYTRAMPPLYENAYEMDNSDPIYEELPLTFLPRNKIKVKECPAYGIPM